MRLNSGRPNILYPIASTWIYRLEARRLCQLGALAAWYEIFPITAQLTKSPSAPMGMIDIQEAPSSWILVRWQTTPERRIL